MLKDVAEAGQVRYKYLTSCPAGLAYSPIGSTLTAKTKMPSKKPVLWTYVTPDEHAEIQANAKRAGLSCSTYMKRVCLGLPTPSLEKQQYRLELLKINADIGRLGGLFKLCLSEKETPLQALHPQVRHVLREIEARQREMKTLISKI